jgi:hypothetical protein
MRSPNEAIIAPPWTMARMSRLFSVWQSSSTTTQSWLTSTRRRVR